MKWIGLLIVSMGLFLSDVVFAKDLSLREKIGQMFIVGFDGKTVNADSSIVKNIENDHIGGVILFDYNFKTKIFDKNIESPSQVQRLNRVLQAINHHANIAHERPDLPLLISVDYEGGVVNRLREEYGFPKTVSAADAGKMDLIALDEAAHAMAWTLHGAGFNLDFAPVLDVNVNPDNPVIGKLGRSFSDNPWVVSTAASLYSSQFISNQVQCAYKHFPGHGSSSSDSHLGFVDVTETWQSYELEPYQQLLNTKGSCGMVMTAHIVNRQLDESGLPATLSHKVLTGILREQLHFDGVIITDDMQMKAISDHYGLESALVMAINAGADMFIFGNQLAETPQSVEQLIDLVEQNVKSGVIRLERVDDAYRHVVRFKASIHNIVD